MAPARPNWLAYDWGLVFLVAAIVALGFVNLGSAAPDPVLLYRQSVALGLGLLLAFLLQFLSRRRLFGLAYPLYGASLLLLALVLVVGREINGARAWFVLGPLQFQPLELAKLGLLLALAKALEGRPIARVWDYALPALLTLPVVGLLLLQPDLGGALVVLFGVFVVVFVRGLPWRHLLVGLFALALLVPTAVWPNLKPYQRERVLIVLDPYRDPLGQGFQVIQSTIAIGSGGFSARATARAPRPSSASSLPAHGLRLLRVGRGVGVRGRRGASGALRPPSRPPLRPGPRLPEAFRPAFPLGVRGDAGLPGGGEPGGGPGGDARHRPHPPLFSYGGSSLIATLAGLGLVLLVHRDRYQD